MLVNSMEKLNPEKTALMLQFIFTLKLQYTVFDKNKIGKRNIDFEL